MPKPDATLAIVAGGAATRLGGIAKGMLRLEGRTFIERLLDLRDDFAEVLLAAREPGPYARYGLRLAPDIIHGRGAPGGVHGALVAARTKWVVAVGCDMPFVTRRVVEALLAERSSAVDVVHFEVGGRPEPLLAAYRTCAHAIWADALARAPSFSEIFMRLRVNRLDEGALQAVDPELLSVRNVNSPEDLAAVGAIHP